MAGLTPLGTIHTVISLIAVAAGVAALVRYKVIDTMHATGRWYVALTVLTCVTGFGIFQHGGFGKPHMLGVITLVVIAVALFAGYRNLFGRASRYVETIAYSTTLFFHAIPAVTETMTRLPIGRPLADGPDASVIQTTIAGCFLALIIGVTWQVFYLRRLRRSPDALLAAAP